MYDSANIVRRDECTPENAQDGDWTDLVGLRRS